MNEQRQVIQDGPGGALSPTFGRPTSGNSALIVKLQREIKSLRDANRDIMAKYEESRRDRDVECEQEVSVLRNQNGDVSGGYPGINCGGVSSRKSAGIHEAVQVDIVLLENSPTQDSSTGLLDSIRGVERTRHLSCSSTQTVNEEENEKVMYQCENGSLKMTGCRSVQSLHEIFSI